MLHHPGLTEPIEVTGHVSLILYVVLLGPGHRLHRQARRRVPGRARDLPDRRHHPGPLPQLAGRARPLTPGEIYELSLDLSVTSNVFLPGHRIRLEVSSSNFPRFDRNTNTGGVIADDADDRPGRGQPGLARPRPPQPPGAADHRPLATYLPKRRAAGQLPSGRVRRPPRRRRQSVGSGRPPLSRARMPVPLRDGQHGHPWSRARRCARSRSSWERAGAPTYRVRAFRTAAEVVAGLPRDDLERRARTGRLTDLKGIGKTTAQVVTEALAGTVPAYLAGLEERAAPLDADGGRELRAALRGDRHPHSDWSDGGSSIEAMARAARDLGHQWAVLTDHSPRLKVARGLTADRLLRQLDVVAAVNADLAPFRLLTGIECDILSDGSLDQRDDLLERLDVVVASAHSELRMPAPDLTRRPGSRRPRRTRPRGRPARPPRARPGPARTARSSCPR